MTATYAASSSNKDRVRLLCNDTDVDNAIFSDDEINTFITVEDSDFRLAAALALETMASREALIQKRIRLMDLQTDGPSVAKALLERAALLRSQADVGTLDYAELAITPFQQRQRRYKQSQRGVI